MSLRLVHFSDTHLGYRAYNRTLPNGINVREADVFQAFREVLRRTADLEPDLILVSGDVFHSVRPSNFIIYQTFRELARFRERCRAPVVVIAGNHESPRSQDTGCILRLYDVLPDLHVVDIGWKQVVLPELEVSVFCLPHRALPEVETLDLSPAGGSKHSVLMLHGTLEGISRSAYDGAILSRSRILKDQWSYIACGHYHLHTRLAQNAYYSGSTEYTSLNIWEETREPKGFIEYDLEKREEVAFHRITTREVLILPSIDCLDRSPKEISTRIEETVEHAPGGIDDKIVRLALEGLTRQDYQHLDHRKIREYRSRALHFDLAVRPPQTSAERARTGADRHARTLEVEWEEFIATGSLPADLERDEVRARGLKLLSEVESDVTD